MSWFTKTNPEAEALAEEYGSLSRHAAKLQDQLDVLHEELAARRDAACASDDDNAQVRRDLAFWRSEAARLSIECKAEFEYVRLVGESVRAQRAELNKLIADARAEAFRRGWLHGLDDLDEVLAYGVLEERRARARNYDLDDCGILCADPAADDDDLPF